MLKFGLICAMPLIALIELFIISLIVSTLDYILDDLFEIIKKIAKWGGGDK